MPTEECSLCRPDLSPVLSESPHWRLVLNRSQNLLGKVFLALKRHCEAVAEVTPEEWADLQEQIQKTASMLRAAFQPDHFNYLFLMNQDHHVHMHIVPRYASSREFSGSVFHDSEWPGAFAALNTGEPVTPKMEEALIDTLKN